MAQYYRDVVPNQTSASFKKYNPDLCQRANCYCASSIWSACSERVILCRFIRNGMIFSWPKQGRQEFSYQIKGREKDCAGILEQPIGIRNRVGTEFSYRPASLCSLLGRYDNPIPTWFLAPIDWSKISALVMKMTLCRENLKVHRTLKSRLNKRRRMLVRFAAATLKKFKLC